eukprot:998676-Amphidinium_carterae.1
MNQLASWPHSSERCSQGETIGGKRETLRLAKRPRWRKLEMLQATCMQYLLMTCSSRAKRCMKSYCH